MPQTIDEINNKIKTNKAQVLTASEAKILIKEKGIKHFSENIDIVTCATFEINTNAFLYLSFGQTDPLIYFMDASINDIPACITGPTDVIISSVSSSKNNIEYSGSSIVEDLVCKKDLHLKAAGRNLEVFPAKEFETWFNLKDLNYARLFLNQAINQNSIVAANSGDKDINSNMGTLIAKLENSTFNSSSYLNPLINDPACKTIGTGTNIWVAGSRGVILGHGSNHNPSQHKNKHNIPVGPSTTLSLFVDIENMHPKWIRGGFIKSFGPVLYVGIGIPIPVLNDEIAEHLAITDDMINTTIIDFSIPRRSKPILGQCTYNELRTSTVLINNKPTLTASLSSMAYAFEICKTLKEEILNRNFLLAEPSIPINMNGEFKKLDSRLSEFV